MPKPGYASLTIKEGDVKRLNELAAKNGLTTVALMNILIKNLPDADLHTILTALEHAKSLKLSRSLKTEAALLLLGKLYHYFDCLSSVLQSVLPSYWVSVGPFRFPRLDAFREEIYPYSALLSVGVLDADVDPLALLADLLNVKSCISRALQENRPGWEAEFHNRLHLAPLPRSLPVPSDLLKPEIYVKKEAQETLRYTLQPYLEELTKICHEAEETLMLLKEDYPDILKIAMKPLRDFMALFKLGRTGASQAF